MGRLTRIGTGYALIAAGTVMLVVPGPGLLTIAGGLAMLSEDVAWAGKATDWVKTRTGRPRADGTGSEADLSESAGSD